MPDTLLEALLEVQATAPPLPKDATNPHFKSKYTPLDTIVKTIGPLLAKNGLVWISRPARDGPGGELVLHYRLVHAKTGEAIDGSMPLLAGQETPQGMGSAITYARRYAMCAVLNLVADDDDDAAASSARAPASGTQPASTAQRQLMGRLRREKGLTRPMLEPILNNLGLGGVELKEGWTESLSKQSASRLIERLKQLPDVEPEAPPDVPPPANGEFVHLQPEGEGLFEPCVCGHLEGDHRSAGSGLPHPVRHGACRLCDCREFRLASEEAQFSREGGSA